MQILKLINLLAPEVIEKIENRYLILKTIYYKQPIGRRPLSLELDLTERFIRNEVIFLKSQGLVNTETMGMYVTEYGESLLDELGELYSSLKGIPDLETKLEDLLHLKKAYIVPGLSESNELILKDMGKITSTLIKKLVKPKDIIGITGGSTMASVADEMTHESKEKDIIVIPARGGLGREVETQANSIAAKIGQKLGGSYRLLFVPDNLEKEAVDIISKNQEIKEAIDLINNLNILIFGIGRADTMANRRNLSEDKINYLMDAGSVAEAFGHYFDIRGNEIWEYKTIGLSIEKFKETEQVIGVAGGEEKAEAIIGISNLRKDMILVTDEKAANKIISLINNNQ